MESLWSNNCDYFALTGRVLIKVVDVYDGDTITAITKVPSGNLEASSACFAKFRFRLFGIDAPEMRGEDRVRGRHARNRLAQLLIRSETPILDEGRLKKRFNDGTSSYFAWAECTPNKSDKYGRVLARVFLDEKCTTTQCVNDILVQENHARPFMCT